MRLTLAALLALTALPAAAFDIKNMSDAERQTFRDEIRAYLLENPEVLQEAVDELSARNQAAQASADLELVKANFDKLVNDPNSWVGGNPNGDVTVVEFTDYRCGYCRKAFGEVQELVKSDGNIRLILREYPILGEQSIASARFAVAVRQLAGDEAYIKAHDALITLRGDATPEVLSRLATTLGHDANKVLAKMGSPEVTAVLQANLDLGDVMQITGTPTFLVGGKLVRSYLPLEDMKAVVAEERKS